GIYINYAQRSLGNIWWVYINYAQETFSCLLTYLLPIYLSCFSKLLELSTCQIFIILVLVSKPAFLSMCQEQIEKRVALGSIPSDRCAQLILTY
ncbi:hypothetical protein C0J52_07419, partial [Blattella germanica]